MYVLILPKNRFIDVFCIEKLIKQTSASTTAVSIAGFFDSGKGIDWICLIMCPKRLSDKRKSILGIFPATFQLNKDEKNSIKDLD